MQVRQASSDSANPAFARERPAAISGNPHAGKELQHLAHLKKRASCHRTESFDGKRPARHANTCTCRTDLELVANADVEG